jgi:hypothetical protein
VEATPEVSGGRWQRPEGRSSDSGGRATPAWELSDRVHGLNLSDEFGQETNRVVDGRKATIEELRAPIEDAAFSPVRH